VNIFFNASEFLAPANTRGLEESMVIGANWNRGMYMNQIWGGTRKISCVLVSVVIRVLFVIKEEMLHYAGKVILLLLKNNSPWAFQLPMGLL